VKRLTSLLLVTLAIVVAASGCTSSKTPEEMLTKTWQLKTFRSGGGMPPPDFMSQTQFMFRPDGRYEILMGELDVGTWKLSENKKVLLTYPDGTRQENSIDVEFLSDSLLILSNPAGPQPVRMELVPMGTLK
jgi:hypothetical protein